LKEVEQGLGKKKSKEKKKKRKRKEVEQAFRRIKGLPSNSRSQSAGVPFP
jgi:hypothetical protein